jgi:hypothetical protein
MSAKLAKYIGAFVITVLITGMAHAQQRASSDEAVKFVKNAVTYLKKHGKE